MSLEQAVEAESEQSGFVLARNFGVQIRNKSYWWPAGHQFDPAKDAELISKLHRLGAKFKAD